MYSSLSPSGPIKWNHNQESSLVQDVSPFSPDYDGRSTTTLSERIRELYLQFLWLPESIMPLGQFIHMVQSLVKHSNNDDPSSDDAHPLHAALDGILLTGKWCSHKYQEQLPNAVVSHASCADLEASIMLFVWERHAPCPEQPNGTTHDSMDDKKRWLSGIEKREVKIQILLHLLKLSLPGQCPPVPVRPVPVPLHASKRRRVQQSSDDDEDATPRTILEDRLEGLMDRLVLWQMALPDAETANADVDGTKSVRDWTQTFCDDVVQPAFAEKLPEQYKLLRRKLFRIPQWTSESESDSDADEDIDTNGKSVPQGHPEPPPLFNSHVNANNDTKQSRSAARSQSRSRSLSVSLEQEAAAGLRRTESKPRRVIQREVSMSKVFKTRRNDGPNGPPPVMTKVEAEAEIATAAATTTQSQATKGPIVLVESTPQKPKAKLSKSKSSQVHRKPS